MAVDVSTIALAVDSTDAVKAKDDLNNLVPAADAVEKATDRVTASTAQMGAGMAQASATTVRSRTDMSDAAQKYIAALQKEIDTFGRTRAEIERLEAASLGFNKAERDKAAALGAAIDAMHREEDAAKALATQQDRAAVASAAFISRLREQTAIQGLSKTELLAYQAAQLGVTKEALPMIAALESAAAKTATHKMETNAASSAMEHFGFTTARSKTELVVLAHELAQGNVRRFGTSMMVLGEQTGAATLLFNPLGIAIAAVAIVMGSMAVAAYKGYEQLETLKKSLILTGNYAGVTAGSFDEMAKSIANSTHTTLGSAQSALQAVVSSGRFGPDLLRPASEAVAHMADLTGESASKIVADFDHMADGVAKYVAEHNKSTHLITAAQYEQIKALEEAGRAQDAQLMYFDLFNKRAAEHEKDIGSIAAAWRGARQWLSEYIQRWEDLGKGGTVNRQLDIERGRLADLEKANNSRGVVGLSGRFDKEIEYARQTITALENSQQLADKVARATADSDKRQQAGIEGSIVVKRLDEEVDKRDKAIRKIEEYTVAVKKMRDAGDPMAPTPQKEAETIAALRAKGEKKGGHMLSPEDVDLEQIKKGIQAEDAVYASREKMLQLYFSRGLMDETDYYANRQAAQAENLQKTKQGFDKELALLQSRITTAATPDQRIRFQKELVDVQEKYNAALAKIAQTGAEDAITRIGKAAQQSAKLMEADALAVARKIEAQEKLVQTERYAFEQVGKTKTQIEEERIARLEVTEALQQQRIATMELFGFGAEEIDQQKLLLALQREDIALKKQALVASKQFSTGAQEAFVKYEEAATDKAGYAEKFVTGSLSRLEDAIVNFTKTGKLNFSSLFQYMADEFIRQQVRMLIASQTAGAGSGGSGGGIFGWLGSLLGSGSTSGGGAGQYLGGDAGASTVGMSLAVGTNYIPRDGFPAMLHEGEAVVPKAFNPAAGGMGASASPNVVNNIHVETPQGYTGKVSQKQNSSGGADIRVQLLEMVASDVNGGGIVHDAMQRRFQLNPGGSVPRY